MLMATYGRKKRAKSLRHRESPAKGQSIKKMTEGGVVFGRRRWSGVQRWGLGCPRVRDDVASVRCPVHALDAVRELLNAGIVTITVGGGGIPVIRNEEGDIQGVAAVIDKDYASSLLARSINADLLLISTAVEKVYLNYNKPDQEPIDVMTLAEAQRYMAEGHFAKGSMLPKIQAITWFLEAGGREAIITNPENIARALRGETGTRILPD